MEVTCSFRETSFLLKMYCLLENCRHLSLVQMLTRTMFLTHTFNIFYRFFVDNFNILNLFVLPYVLDRI